LTHCRCAMVKTVTLALTGASGAQYGLRLLQVLLEADCRVYLLVSKAAEVVIRRETSFELPEGFSQQERWFLQTFKTENDKLRLFDREDWFSPVASGSGAPEAMVICPASGGILSALA